MKTTSLRVLALGAGLAAFPWMAMSANMSDALPLRVDESAHALESQTKVNPFDAIALNNEAVKMSRDGDQLNALQLLLRASRLSPDNKTIERNLKDLNGWMARRTASNQPLEIDNAQRSQLPEPPPLWNNPASTLASATPNPAPAPISKAKTSSRSRVRSHRSRSYSRLRSRSSLDSNSNSGTFSNSGSTSGSNSGASYNSGSSQGYNSNQGPGSGNSGLQNK